MSTIKFYYGSMNCGKSTYVLQLRHSLENAGFRPVLLKPSTDTRDPGVIKSRMGIEHPCVLVGPEEHLLMKMLPTHLIVDEAQFLSARNIEDIRYYADQWNVEVILFGLRTDYSGKLFEASANIMAIADDLIELPIIYRDGQKANMHIRRVDGEPVFDGGSIFVGDIDDEYESVSRREYFRIKDNLDEGE